MATAVDVSNLESKLKMELPDFIESKLAVKSERAGDEITFEDKNDRTHVSTPQIKTYLKRFIQKNELKKKYRLLSEDGTFTFKKLPADQAEEDEE